MIRSVAALSSLPGSDLWSIVGGAVTLVTGILGFAAKLISDLRSDNKALQDKMFDKVVPALEVSATAAQALVGSTQRIVDALLDSGNSRRRR